MRVLFWTLAVAALALPSTALAAPPANDNFANAVTPSDFTVTGTNVDATKEPGEPDHAGNAGGASVWYTVRAPFSGTATLGTCGSDFDTLLGIYTGNSVNALTEVASNNDSCGNQSQVTGGFVEGATYYAAVDGAGGAMGNLKLTLTFGSPPPPGGGGSVAHDFSFGDLKRNTQRGTAKLAVNVPGAGSLALAGTDLRRASAQAQGAGTVRLPVEAKGEEKARLNDEGRVKVKPKVTLPRPAARPTPSERPSSW